MADIPEPEKVLKASLDLLLFIYSSLDYGTFKATEFFEKEKKAVDRFLAPNLVRYHAKQSLSRNQAARFKIENVPNNGLYIYDNNYNIRILKSNRALLPVPGHSIARQRYYQQIGPQISLGFSIDAENQENNRINLVALWEVNGAYKMDSLSLACPKDGGLKRDSVAAYWHYRVDYKTLLDNKGNINTINLRDIIEDLPLTFKTDEEIADGQRG